MPSLGHVARCGGGDNWRNCLKLTDQSKVKECGRGSRLHFAPPLISSNIEIFFLITYKHLNQFGMELTVVLFQIV